MLGDAHALPARVVEARCVPSGFLEARVVDLATVDFCRLNRAGGGFPLCVGRNRLTAAIRRSDFELRQQRKPIAVMVSMLPESDLPTVPAAAEERSDDVVAASNQARDVIGLVLQSRRVTRPPRRQHVVANAL